MFLSQSDIPFFIDTSFVSFIKEEFGFLYLYDKPSKIKNLSIATHNIAHSRGENILPAIHMKKLSNEQVYVNYTTSENMTLEEHSESQVVV